MGSIVYIIHYIGRVVNGFLNSKLTSTHKRGYNVSVLVNMAFAPQNVEMNL